MVAALHGGHEVREVIAVAAAGPGPQRRAVVGESRPRGVARRDGEALGPIPDVAGVGERLRSLQPVGHGRLDRQAADVGDQQGVVPLVDGHLAVGDVAVVDVAESAAEAHHPPRQFLLAEAPAGLVELVRILVAEIAVAGEVRPVPVVVEFLARRHVGRGRSCPEIEVEPRRDRGGRIDQADAVSLPVADGPCRLDRSELAALHEVESLSHAAHAAALHAHLAHAAELPRPLRDHAAFLDVVAAGLFDVHILAGLHRPHGHQGMPMIRRGDRDGVDVAAVEQTAHVLHVLRRPLLVLELLLAEPHVRRRIAVADGDEIDIGDLLEFGDVSTPLPVDTDHRHADLVARATGRLGLRLGCGGGGGGRQAGEGDAGRGQGLFQKIATGWIEHGAASTMARRVWGGCGPGPQHPKPTPRRGAGHRPHGHPPAWRQRLPRPAFPVAGAPLATAEGRPRRATGMSAEAGS